jgi:hypothetical protein
MKAYVRNKAHPEGSIAEGYILEECLTFCLRFLDVDTKDNSVDRHEAVTVNEPPSVLSIFFKNGLQEERTDGRRNSTK